MTMASRPAPSISRSQASMLRLASSIACSFRPTCWTEEPQQPEPATFTTSMSWRVSSRTVASLTSGASTCWPQPGISATRLRRRPAAGKVCGRSTGEGPASRSGTASSIAFSRRRKVAPPGSALAAGSSRQRLGEPAQHHGPAEQRRPRHQPGEHAAQEAVGQRARVARLDVMPAMIDQVHVVHARRAGRHAGQARQAAVDVPDLGLARRAIALEHRLDEVDAPARAVALVAQQHEGRAGRGAEAAMHALAQDVLAARGLRIGELGQGEVGLHAHRREGVRDFIPASRAPFPIRHPRPGAERSEATAVSGLALGRPSQEWERRLASSAPSPPTPVARPGLSLPRGTSGLPATSLCARMIRAVRGGHRYPIRPGLKRRLGSKLSFTRWPARRAPPAAAGTPARWPAPPPARGSGSRGRRLGRARRARLRGRRRRLPARRARSGRPTSRRRPRRPGAAP